MTTEPQGTSLEDFLKTASPEQRDLVLGVMDKMADAADREERLCKRIEEHNRVASRYSNLRVSHECEAMALEESHSSLSRQVMTIQTEIGGYLQQLVDNGLAHLGIVQRNYEHYTGKKLPE